MSEFSATNDEVLDSNSESPQSKTGGSSKNMVRRSAAILISIVVVSAVTALSYRLFSANPDSMQPSISVKEVVDANSSTSDLQMSPDTLQPNLPDEPVNTQSNQSSQPELSVDPQLMELLTEIPYEQRQTRDALVYFDNRMETLIELQPTLQSLISNQEDNTVSMENRMLAVESALQEIRNVLDRDDADGVEVTESLPPFRLIAIDRWENQWNAVIELDGRITMIQPQEIRAGWKLLKIIPLSASAVFRSKSGEQTILKID